MNSISERKKMKSIFLILITLFTQSIMGQQTGNFSSKELKEKVNIKYIGEYYTGRDPCQYLPNGTRRWRYITGFKVKENVLGNIQVKNIEINPNYNKDNGTDISLEVGKNYIISLILDKERIKILENKNTLFTHLNLITNEEIAEITEVDTNLRFCNKIIIQKGYLIGNRSTIIDDTLILEPKLAGVGGVTWVFEISNNELVIVDFRWNVRPNEMPQLHSKYIKKLKRTDKLIIADLEYKTYANYKDTTNKENYVNLVGYVVNQDIEVDIKRKYPYWTNIKDTVFVGLLKKYHLKIKS